MNINKNIVDELKELYYNKKQPLKELENLFSNVIISNMYQFVGLCDLDGILVRANDSALKAAGLIPEDVIGKPFWEAYWWTVDEETVMKLKDAINKSKKGEIVRYDVKINAPNIEDKKTVFIDFIIRPIFDSTGNAAFLIPEAIDIDEKKKMETKLIIEKEKAITASKAKSMFLATMTHDLRTPLHGIQCILDILLDEVKYDPSPVKKYKLNIAKKSSNLLLDIINNILNFSAFEHNEVKLNKVNFSLKEFVQDIYNILQHKTSKKNLDFKVICPDIFVKTDKFVLNQIIINLTGNAIKFTNEGCISIEIHHTEIKDTFNIKIDIIDTGIGMTKEVAENIFKSFYRATDVRNSNIVGTGLGLGICEKAVHLLKGNIKVSSTPNVGTIFTVILNLEKGEKIESNINLLNNDFDESYSKKYPLTILASDDNIINRIVMEEFLIKFGYSNVDFAEDGQEMINMSLNKKYDVIFTDVRMPKYNGIDAYNIIKEKLGCFTPITVVVTANTLETDKKKYREAGIKYYLSKPFKVSDMKFILQNVYNDLLYKNI